MKDTGNNHVPHLKSRRDWMLLAGRIAAATALGFGGALLLRRSGSCPDGSCSACPEQGGCKKPDADAFRKQVRRGGKKL